MRAQEITVDAAGMVRFFLAARLCSKAAKCDPASSSSCSDLSSTYDARNSKRSAPRAQIPIPDCVSGGSSGPPSNAAELAGRLIELGKCHRPRVGAVAMPEGLVGPGSEPEPEVFARARASRAHLLAHMEKMRQTAPRRDFGRRTVRDEKARSC